MVGGWAVHTYVTEMKRREADLEVRKNALDEERRLAEEAAAKSLADLAAQQRALEDEKKRLAEEAAAKEQAELDAQQRALEDEKKRFAEEAAAKERAELAAQRRALEDERKRLAEEAAAAKERAELAAMEKAAQEKAAAAYALKVPVVLKMHVQAADALLSKSGLRLGKVTTRITPGLKAGFVLEQQPAAGTAVKRDAIIDVVVSMEPPLPVTIEVPLVVRMDVKEASAVLSNHGLRVGTITSEPSKDFPGRVVYQRPRAGTMVERNSAVDLVVSEGLPQKKGQNSVWKKVR